MKRLFALFVALALCGTLTRANTFGTDASDLWWNPNESGWGVNVIHQGEIVFLIFFIYGTDKKPVWYVAPNVPYVSTGSQGEIVFTGILYQTAGPWFGTFFDTNLVTNRVVGPVTFTMKSVSEATISYFIDTNIIQNRPLVRQTWRNNNLAGSYTGAMRQVQSGCVFPAVDGTFIVPVTFSVAQQTNSLVVVANSSADNCTYTGNYAQAGRMGSSNGNYSCASQLKGTYQFFEVEGSSSAMSGRFSAVGSSCAVITGRLSGVRN